MPSPAGRWRGRVAPGPGLRVMTETIRFPFVLDLLERLSKAELGAVLYDQSCDTGRAGVHGVHLRAQRPASRPVLRIRSPPRPRDRDGARVDGGGAVATHLHRGLARRLLSPRLSGAPNERRQPRRGGTSSASPPPSTSATCARSPPRPSRATWRSLVEKLRRVDIEHVIVVDLTHEEVGIPVVRVIVPGLEGCSLLPNYAPGRAGSSLRAKRPGGVSVPQEASIEPAVRGGGPAAGPLPRPRVFIEQALLGRAPSGWFLRRRLSSACGPTSRDSASRVSPTSRVSTASASRSCCRCGPTAAASRWTRARASRSRPPWLRRRWSASSAITARRRIRRCSALPTIAWRRSTRWFPSSISCG